MATESNDRTLSSWSRLLREPTLHFFALAAAALLIQRLAVDDPRTIEITPALKADLLRRYHDQLGRPPTGAEAKAFMAAWVEDEALYREALREGIDRDDPAVRNLLIAKLRERLLLESRIGEPTAAELQAFLEQHRADYEAPLIYEHDFISFPKQAGGEQQREKYQRLLTDGATPASLGLPSTGANVNRERMEQELGPEVAEQITRLSPGTWQKLETADRLLLVRLVRIHGGLPEPATLHEQLVGGWKRAMAQKALARAAQAVGERYRVLEKSP